MRGHVWLSRKGPSRPRARAGRWFQLDRAGLGCLQAFLARALTLTSFREYGPESAFERFWTGLFARCQRPLRAPGASDPSCFKTFGSQRVVALRRAVEREHGDEDRRAGNTARHGAGCDSAARCFSIDQLAPAALASRETTGPPRDDRGGHAIWPADYRRIISPMCRIISVADADPRAASNSPR